MFILSTLSHLLALLTIYTLQGVRKSLHRRQYDSHVLREVAQMRYLTFDSEAVYRGGQYVPPAAGNLLTC